MMMPRFLVLFLVLLPCSNSLFSLKEKEIEVIPNPHGGSACASRNLDGLLEPYHLIIKPLTTQPDTFQELEFRKIMSVPVPVYRMKQPARLSEAQLEFQLVLVKDLAKAGRAAIHETPVEKERAMDSWFPGYYWTPLVMACAEGAWQHVGWKFTAVNESQGLPHFYALMVTIDEEETTEGIRIGGFKAPGW
eukprot:CAMPEP_0119013140 /NCGR_PEP_ID=MMETSP1176-20130426/7998_1 /TAXON_ID=265551 /ORGANISM="Synedropsis recta cf, Strain CCMP1620" /LENGTH=190 /DNA_ID=CAMNT_0006966195 /DNA_START=56 /DNA_END=625 /DNA_ORIENTATION=-